MGPVVVEKLVQYRDSFLNHSPEISPPGAIGGGIFDGFRDNFRPNVADDVVSGVAVVARFGCSCKIG